MLLVGVCCLLFVVRWLWSVVHRAVFVAVFCWLLFVFDCCVLFVGWMFVACCLLFVVRCVMFGACCSFVSACRL